MHISIKTLKGKSINLEVEDSPNTINLRIHGEPIRELVLGLDPCRTPGLGAVMTIFVKTLTGNTHTLEVKRTATIGKVKAKLAENDSTRVDQQRLIFQGMLLEDSRTIGYYQIQNEATLVMMTRLCGC